MRTYEQRTDGVLEKVKTKKRQKKIRLTAILSCAAAFILALNLTLFVPYTTGGFDATQYRDSEYYSVIEKLGARLYAPAKKANNFERLFGGRRKGVDNGTAMSPSWGSAGDMSSAPSAAPDSSGGKWDSPSMEESSGSSDRYEEVTDNQVVGVTEGDLIKRSNNTLFYLTQNSGMQYMLRAYSIAGEDSELISEYEVQSENGVSFSGYGSEREMYLSQDLKTVTIVTPCYNYKTYERYTAIISVDVSNLQDMRVVRTSYISGSLVSSRIVGENLLVVSNFYVYSSANFNDANTFIPCTGTLDEMNCLPVEDIVLPDVVTYSSYTVLTTLNAETAELLDSLALLSFSNEAYVSLENIYVTRGYTETVTYTYKQGGGSYEAAYVTGRSYTELARIAYSEDGALTLGARGTVDGSLNNRYSMDESGDTLRIFTTVSSGEPQYVNGYWKGTGSSASLFVLNVADLSLRTSVERFAPEYESVRSARFKGDKAYVCTAVVVTDPVFIFDLSDLDNITYTHTGNIPGYSISLVDFKDDTLLGIGYDDNFDLKIELYRQEGEKVVTVGEPIKVEASFSTNYKSYYINREKGLVGLAMKMNEWIGGYYSVKYEYRLYQFDGYKLREVTCVPLEGGGGYGVRYDEARAFVADGYLYVVDASNFVVTAVEI